MDVQALLPGTEALASEGVSIEPGQVAIRVRSVQPRARCPDCQQPAHRVHSGYERTLTDLPMQHTPVRLHLRLRRFFCDNDRCARRTFIERLPEVMVPYARQTARLRATQQDIGVACGGEGGSRLAARLGMPVSADTLLRRVRWLGRGGMDPPRVVGVDDWALRRGQRYGTIICDLERHKPIDLWSERSSEGLKRWLQVHSSVEMISRDRGDEYIKGATEGASAAVQVADRWHLLNNLHEAMMREAERHDGAIGKATQAAMDELASQQAQHAESATRDEAVSAPASRPLTRAEQRKQANRARRLQRYEQVVKLHEQGYSQRAIVRTLQMSRGTVRRFIRAEQFPERAERRFHSRVDPFADDLKQRWQDGCTNAAQLFEELKRKGYTGSYDMVRRKVAAWRDPSQREHTSGLPPKQPPPKLRRPSARRVAWILMKDHADLDEQEQMLRRQIRHHCPRLRRAGSLARWFRRLVKARRVYKLDAWLARARDAQAPPALSRFAKGLIDDRSAVQAAMSLPWSNGQVEGQINRLKLVKRQMYGRANFDLLRARFLHAG